METDSPEPSEPLSLYGKKWSEKEYLIVLHHYFEHEGEAQHAEVPFVKELSRVLGRTSYSILYRLQNFASIDPRVPNPRRKGKVHISEFGRRIFREWSQKRDSLRDAAEAFWRDERDQLQPDLFNPLRVRVPVTFRDYELLDEIGRGGFGVVLSCLNVKNGGTFALKVIDGSKVFSREYIHRFGREIRALQMASHPNIIRIHEDNLEYERNYPGFVMDLAESDLLRYISTARDPKDGTRPRRPVLSTEEGLAIFSAITDATLALHQSDPPIIHRDINPSNVLRLFDGSWVLSDFSLAKFLPPVPLSTTFSTGSHMAMGTAHYTAPEQYQSLRLADQRSDVFSLGWLAWDLFSAEGPYPRREPTGLPAGLERVFLKATSHDPVDRYPTVGELRQAFLSCF